MYVFNLNHCNTDVFNITVQQHYSDSVCVFHAAVNVYSKPTNYNSSMPHFLLEVEKGE